MAEADGESIPASKPQTGARLARPLFVLEIWNALVAETMDNLDQTVDVLGIANGRVLQQSALGVAGVQDAWPLRRVDISGEPWWVLYFVADESVSANEIEVAAQASGWTLPTRWAAVSSLPLLPDGRVDEPALLALGVVDAVLLRELTLKNASAFPDLTWSLENDYRAVESAGEPPSASHPENYADAPMAFCSGGRAAFIPQGSLIDIVVRLSHNNVNGLVFVDEHGTRRMSYAELFQEALRVVTTLRERGAQEREPVLLLCDNRSEFVPAFWGILLAGLVPVPLPLPLDWSDDDANVAKLRNAARLLEGCWVLAQDDVATPIQHDPVLYGLVHSRLLSVEACSKSVPSSSYSLPSPDAPAVMLMTSGSTGVPKLVVQSHRAIVHQVTAAAERLALSPTDVSLNWFPLDHVGGLVMFHIRDVAAGLTQVQVRTTLVISDPLLWFDLMDEWRVTISWSPNFGYGLVTRAMGQGEPRSWDLSQVRVLMNGGEAVSARTAADFLEAMAPHRLGKQTMVSAWGMSETCSAVTYETFDARTTSADSKSVSVGRPIPGVQLRIVDEDSCVAREGIVGQLQIKGETVTSGYFDNSLANDAAFTADGWFSTGDLAVISDGRLTVVGRGKDTVVVNGLSIPCHELEAIVERVPGVSPSFAAAVAVKTESSEEVGVFLHCCLAREEWPNVVRTVRSALLRSFGLNPRYVLPVDEAAFLKTGIGKIQRGAMSQALADGRFQALIRDLGQVAVNSATPRERLFAPEWRPKQGFPALSHTEPDTLVFSNRDNFFDRLMRSLRGRVVCVAHQMPGQVGIRDGFELDPSDPDAYLHVLTEATDGLRGELRVIHGWSHGRRHADASCESVLQQRLCGFDSVIHIARTLVKLGRTASIVAVTEDVHQAEVPSCAGSFVTALVGIVESDFPGIRFSYVDLAAQSDATNLQTLLEELRNDGRDKEVCYAKGQRLVPGIREMLRIPAALSPIRRNGTYVISGGLGGVGSRVAQWLLSTYDANVLLLGRTPIDSTRDEAAVARERLAAFTPSGGSIRYAAVDVGDTGLLGQAIQLAERAWGQLTDGVFHFAGIYDAGNLGDRSAGEVSALMHAKVAGSLALEACFRHRSEVFFVNASSAITLIRGAGTGVYAASNSFVERFTRRQRLHRRAWCIAWSMWDGIGMARNVAAKSLMARKGLRALPSCEAVAAIERVLQQHEPLVYVGLDAGRPLVKRLLAHSSGSLRVTVRGSSRGIPLPKIQDAFGTDLDLEHISEPSATDVGAASRGFQAPSTFAEQTLAKLWMRILDVRRVGKLDNFFEQGGTSLTAAELLAGAEKIFGRRLGFAALMTRPTLQALAQALAGEEGTGDVRLLVPMQTQGQRPPFFGAHPLFGLVYPYTSLARHLGKDQPFYALQARAYVPGQSAHCSIEDMAADYVKAIRAVQPIGPYFLGGWSFGSLIAIEMAQQLKSIGESIGCLAIIDQATDSLERFFDEVPTRIKLERFFSIVEDAMRASDPYFSKHQGWGARLARPLKLFNFARSVLFPMIRIGMIHTKIARTYQLKPYDGDISLLHTGDPEFTRITDDRLGWDKLVSGRVTVYRIPGNHLTLHSAPNVEVLANSLSTALAAGRARMAAPL